MAFSACLFWSTHAIENNTQIEATKNNSCRPSSHSLRHVESLVAPCFESFSFALFGNLSIKNGREDILCHSYGVNWSSKHVSKNRRQLPMLNLKLWNMCCRLIFHVCKEIPTPMQKAAYHETCRTVQNPLSWSYDIWSSFTLLSLNAVGCLHFNVFCFVDPITSSFQFTKCKDFVGDYASPRTDRSRKLVRLSSPTHRAFRFPIKIVHGNGNGNKWASLFRSRERFNSSITVLTTR